MVKALKLPPKVVDALINDGPDTLLESRLSWALSYLKAAGAVDNSKRVWSLLKRGRTLTEADTREIVRAYRAEAAKKAKERKATQQPESIEHGSESLDWKSELLRVVRDIPAEGFERLCKRLLREKGFQRVEVSGRPGDGGIDGHGEFEVGLISFRVVFQAKRWKGTVGASTVRDFRGAMMGRADKGLILTTGTFSADARKEATRDGAPPIDLFDGDRLCDLLQELSLGVTTEQVPRVRIDEGFFKTI